MQQFVNKMHGGQMAKGHESKSGALLDMLAEVASQKLHSDPAVQSPATTRAPTRLTSKPKRFLCHGKAANSTSVSLSELQNLSPNHLLKLFADFDGDEMKRTFSYTCRIDTVNCRKQFSSFGSENKAREQMKNHLQSHVSRLAAEGSFTKRFETIESQRRKNSGDWKDISVGKKVHRNKNVFHPKEPDENDSNIPNKKLCSMLTKEPISLQKCLNPEGVSKALKQLQCSIYREHNYTSLNLASTPERAAEGIVQDSDFAVIQLFDDNLGVAQYEEIPVYEHSKTSEQGDIVSEQSDGIVMVCCVDDDWMNQLSTCSKSDAVTDAEQLEHPASDYVLVNNKDSQTFESEAVIVNCMEPQEDNVEKKKPKGKAKFIGQSKVEKEMAIAMIESMKRKGNSTECLECRICNPPRVFTAPTTLISHYRSHAGIKPYECRICGSVFTRQHSLNYHMLIHSNKTRFTCSDCGRTFRHPSHFKEHRRRHTGESPYECTDCTVRFKTRNTFKRHMKTRHGKLLTTTGSVIAMSDDECTQAGTTSVPQFDLQAEKKPAKIRKDAKKLAPKRSDNVQPETVTSFKTVISMKSEDDVFLGDIVEQALRQSDISFPNNDENNSKVKVETVWEEPPLCRSNSVALYSIAADQIKCNSLVKVSPLVHTLTATVASNVEHNKLTDRKMSVATPSTDRFDFMPPVAEVCQRA